MIIAQYPPTLTRNFQGECDIVPCYFTELYIDESGREIKIFLSLLETLLFKFYKHISILLSFIS